MTQAAPPMTGRQIPDRLVSPAKRALRSWEALLLLVGVAIFVANSFASPYFLDPWNLSDASFNFTEKALIAFAMAMLIIAGEIDLSVASIIALASTVMGAAMVAGLPVPALVALGLLTGLACGAFNGLLVAGFGLPSIVVTIGTMSLFRGISYILLGDGAFTGYPEGLAWFGQGYVWWVFSFELVLFDSCVKHTHLTSGYNDRRKDVDHGKKGLWEKFPEITKFRDFSVEMLDEVREEIGEISYKRCLYLLKEIKRVEQAAAALSENNAERLGKLLNETHSGLSKEFEVSCDELDFLVEQTLLEKGVLGARMMGGGFGGCTINLIKEDRVEEVIQTIREKYEAEFNIQMKVYKVKISEGTKEYISNEFSI